MVEPNQNQLNLTQMLSNVESFLNPSQLQLQSQPQNPLLSSQQNFPPNQPLLSSIKYQSQPQNISISQTISSVPEKVKRPAALGKFVSYSNNFQGPIQNNINIQTPQSQIIQNSARNITFSPQNQTQIFRGTPKGQNIQNISRISFSPQKQINFNPQNQIIQNFSNTPQKIIQNQGIIKSAVVQSPVAAITMTPQRVFFRNLF